jgi:hypothetical protein
MIRLTTSQIAVARVALVKKQGGKCAICPMKISPKDAVLDHNHVTGLIRGALCRNCNGIEGKVFNLARRAKRDKDPEWWLRSLLAYWRHHDDNPTLALHPLHRTDDEKRIRRNARARKQRAVKRK